MLQLGRDVIVFERDSHSEIKEPWDWFLEDQDIEHDYDLVSVASLVSEALSVLKFIKSMIAFMMLI